MTNIDAVTLAKLAAEKGISLTEALKFLQESEAVLKTTTERQNRLQEARARLAAIPQPPQWPASLDEFYRLIVKAKDRTNCQPRFKRYLRAQGHEAAFKGFKEAGFPLPSIWNMHAQAYAEWWKEEKHTTKQLAGKAGAKARGR
jgi:hypothetical protein